MTKRDKLPEYSDCCFDDVDVVLTNAVCCNCQRIIVRNVQTITTHQQQPEEQLPA